MDWDELKRNIKFTDRFRATVGKNKDFGLEYNFNDFMLLMRPLTSQSSGTRIQNFVSNLLGFKRISKDENSGDFMNSGGKTFEFKSSVISESNSKVNIVQIRPHQDVEGYYILIVDSLDIDNIKHWLLYLSNSLMKAELNLLGNYAHGTKIANANNETKEWRISIPWDKNDTSLKRWLTYSTKIDLNSIDRYAMLDD
jgi:hypothetical protein